jgi:transcriptional regulator with XRE-family HTH domain
MKETLTDLVLRRRKELGMSLRAVADASGGAFTSSTVHSIEHAKFGKVNPDVIAGLAKALRLPEKDVREAAGLQQFKPPPFVLPARANELNARERALVIELIGTLLAAHD